MLFIKGICIIIDVTFSVRRCLNKTYKKRWKKRPKGISGRYFDSRVCTQYSISCHHPLNTCSWKSHYRRWSIQSLRLFTQECLIERVCEGGCKYATFTSDEGNEQCGSFILTADELAQGRICSPVAQFIWYQTAWWAIPCSECPAITTLIIVVCLTTLHTV